MMSDNQYTYWDKVAPYKTFTHPIDFELLSKYLAASDSILDFGCGYGRLVTLLAGNGYSNVIGFDTSQGLITRGLENGVQNIFHIHSAQALPVADNSVDGILLFAVLTCIPSNSGQLDLMALLHSKLKPGGIVYISDYYLQELSTEIERYDCLNGDVENYGVFSLP